MSTDYSLVDNFNDIQGKPDALVENVNAISTHCSSVDKLMTLMGKRDPEILKGKLPQ